MLSAEILVGFSSVSQIPLDDLESASGAGKGTREICSSVGRDVRRDYRSVQVSLESVAMITIERTLVGTGD